MEELEYEALLSIQTTGDQRGFPQLAHYFRYEPTPYTGLDQLFDRCSPGPEDGFVDVGCGKGRVAFYVHHRFRIHVTGIEMNPSFYEECLHNKIGYMKKRARQRGQIDFQCVMAQEYEVKADNTVFYFFNPFSIQIFIAFIQRVLVSVEQVPRTVTLILYYPSEDYVFYLQQHTLFQWTEEIRLEGSYAKNENERFVVFQFHQKE